MTLHCVNIVDPADFRGHSVRSVLVEARSKEEAIKLVALDLQRDSRKDEILLVYDREKEGVVLVDCLTWGESLVKNLTDRRPGPPTVTEVLEASKSEREKLLEAALRDALKSGWTTEVVSNCIDVLR